MIDENDDTNTNENDDDNTDEDIASLLMPYAFCLYSHIPDVAMPRPYIVIRNSKFVITYAF